MTTIGFLGLGKIGMPVSKHLIEAGHEVVGYKRSGIEAFTGIGGKAAASPAEVGSAADIVFLCLPDSDALEAVVNGSDGLMGVAREGQILIGLGSNPVPVKQRHADAFASKGAVFLDGEVSGTPVMVENKAAAIYLAGDESSAEKIRPIVETFTQNCMFLGAFGSATKIKLLNNLLVALNIAGAAQVIAIGTHGGIDPEKLIPAVVKGSGTSGQFAIRAPMMVERKFTPMLGSAKALAYYVGEIRQMAVDAGVSTRLIDEMIDLYEKAVPIIGDRDVAALLEYFEKPE
ncbi:NAD(P)-dependent oxidoreductase [Hoeflea sp. WL0058]|uniref:NAD(P)-dependent oxidoreductase n=1 Tax=Flavimaribacter sediminis TaxID=2865987 RepID=A0AAE2ZLJ2_9HYPH|nr:NAD(P)-dependent oxidoreductase [Flavimaribacter sediminis]MBW8638456.1 NAD(P)-dependent oxidoreductase [Flavimaribacter sediminis]